MRYTDEEKEKLKAICPKCVGYCRISTQNQKDEGMSIDVQQTKIYEKVSVLKGELIEIFTDEAKTGTNLNRPGLTALLARCTKGDIDYLIVQDTSRLSRDTKDYLGVKALLKKEKVDIVALSGMQSQGDDPYSQFLDEIIAAVNALHPRVSGFKARQTAMEKFKAGYYPSCAPIGYVNVKNEHPTGVYDKRIIIPDEKTSVFITDAFKFYASRKFNSIYEVRQYLHKNGVRGKKGRPLQYSVVHHMLRNTFYYGWMKHGGQEGDGKHTHLIDKPTFDIVQQILTDRGEYSIRRRKHNFLLRGIIFCKECQKRYTAEYHYNPKYKAGKGKVGMYHCSQTGKRGKCPARSLSVDNLEDQVALEVAKLEFKPEFIEAVKNQIKNVYQESISKMKLAKKAAENREDAVIMNKERIFRDYSNGKITADEYHLFNKKFDADMLGVQKELADIAKTQTIDTSIISEVLELTRNIAQSYSKVDIDHKRAYLHFFFQKIWVKDRKVVEVEYTPAIQVLQDTHLVILSANWLLR